MFLPFNQNTHANLLPESRNNSAFVTDELCPWIKYSEKCSSGRCFKSDQTFTPQSKEINQMLL